MTERPVVLFDFVHIGTRGQKSRRRNPYHEVNLVQFFFHQRQRQLYFFGNLIYKQDTGFEFAQLLVSLLQNVFLQHVFIIHIVFPHLILSSPNI